MTDSLKKVLESWSGDHRLAPLFAGPGDVSLAMWVAEIQLGSAWQAWRPLYTWVIASVGGERGFRPPPQAHWLELDTADHKFRIHRLVVTAPPTELLELVRGLLTGAGLREAGAKAGVEVPAEFAEVRLGLTEAAIGRSFDAAPIRFLPTDSAAAVSGSWGRSLSSPSKEEPAFLAALVRLRKAEIFCDEAGRPLPGADELARQALTFLAEETGLRFKEEDAARLGNIEWLTLCAANAREQGDVEFATVRNFVDDEVHVEAVRVSVAARQLKKGTPLLVRCRCIAGHEIVTDDIVKLAAGEQHDFPAPSAVSGLLVSAWKLDDTGRGTLWFEDQVFLIKRVAFAMGIMGLTGQLETDWSKKLNTKKEPLKTRVDRVRAISQVHYEESGTGDWTGWEAAEREGVDAAARLFIPESKAQFFPKGWTEKGPGGLAFVEWFVKLTENSSTRTILLVDPYFDTLGVTDFLARARGTHIEYVVLTNTQVSSDDDAVAGGAAPIPRRDRLRLQVEKMRDILGRLSFRLLDLRSTNPKAKAQLFHDRYLLVFDRSGELSAGYHLSNSLQGATKHFPLLVTPIPADVLEQVGEYVAALQAADPTVVTDARVTGLISSENLRVQPVSGGARGLALGGMGRLMAVLTGDQGLKRVAPDKLLEQLIGRGWFNGSQFLPTPEMLQQSAALVLELKGCSPAEFEELWLSLADLWANSHSEALISGLVDASGALVDKLEVFLDVTVQREQAAEALEPAGAGYGHLFRESFAQVFDAAQSLLEYGGHRHFGAAYSSRLAVRVLGQNDTSRLVAWAERAWLSLQQEVRENDASPRLKATMEKLVLILDLVTDHGQLSNERITEALAKSCLPVLRAIAAGRVVRDPVRGNLEAALPRLGLFVPEERVEILAACISHCRLEANRRGSESPDLKQRRLLLSKALVDPWSRTLPQADLARLSFKMGGPGRGWADSTTADVLEPLIAEGKLTWDAVEQVWFDEFKGLITAFTRPSRELADRRPSAHYFHHSSDAPMTVAFAQALQKAGAARRAERLAELSELRKRFTRELSTPFAKSRNFERWTGCVEGLVWLKAVQLLLSQKSEVEIIDKVLEYVEPRSDGAAGFVRELTTKKP